MRTAAGRRRPAPCPARRCVPLLGELAGAIELYEARPGRGAEHSGSEADPRRWDSSLAGHGLRPAPGQAVACWRRRNLDGGELDARRRGLPVARGGVAGTQRTGTRPRGAGADAGRRGPGAMDAALAAALAADGRTLIRLGDNDRPEQAGPGQAARARARAAACAAPRRGRPAPARMNRGEPALGRGFQAGGRPGHRQQLGQQGRSPGGTIGLHWTVVDWPTEFGNDGLGERLGIGGCIVEAPACAVLREPAGHGPCCSKWLASGT